jgi:hypothetical protein
MRADQAAAYEQVQNAPHEAHLSHELIAAAASYEAAKAYEDHVARNGKPDSHAQAKEITLWAMGRWNFPPLSRRKGVEQPPVAGRKSPACAENLPQSGVAAAVKIPPHFCTFHRHHFDTETAEFSTAEQ